MALGRIALVSIKGIIQKIEKEIAGVMSISLENAVEDKLLELKAYGGTEQNGTPTPTTPVDIVSNNGVLKVRHQSGLPLEYQMVEWLKSTGKIPITDFKTKSTQEITTEFYREESGATYIYSSDFATSSKTNTTAYLTTGSGNWRWDGKVTPISVALRTKITSVQSADGVYLNNTKYGSYTSPNDFVSTNDLCLSSTENSTIRIYSMTIREGETVTLDLVPVQRLSDSTYGFYDKVSGNFYTNSDATFVAGDTISDPVEIYTDGEEEVLTISGANLLDPSTSNITIGEHVNAQGQSATAANNWRTDYIPVVGGKTYAFWGRAKADNTISAYCRMNFYESDKTAITPRPSYTQNTVTVATAPSNAAYVCLSCAPISSSNPITRENFDEYNWMFAEASAEVPYQPYVTPQTASVPMLLSVGDYKDECELISGLLTHKVGIKVFDGTENWADVSTGGTIRYACDISPAPFIESGVTRGKIISTHFAFAASGQSVGTGFTYKTMEGVNKLYLIPNQSLTTVASFKAWLTDQYNAGTPVIVVYPLDTPTTESVAGQTMHIPAGNSTIEITQASLNTLELSAKYKALP